MRNLLRKPAAILFLWLLVQPNVFAFDTFWHSAATGAVGREFHFSDDANNIMQFGNFAGPDFFGPLYDTVIGERSEKWDQAPNSQLFLSIVHMLKEPSPQKVRKSAIYMHFDNLNGRISSNSQFDYLFFRLLYNTQQNLAKLYIREDLNEGIKKIAILETLGASLHMVQDFYSHSDWTHNDFPKMGVPLVKTSWGKERAPTWFEVRAKLGDPEQWPFHVHSGIYPPREGEERIHTHMNHDNSQLIYEKASQKRYHDAGPYPSSNGASEHQLFAVNTAAGASIEWVRLVETFPSAKRAIDYARTWDLKKYNPVMQKDLSNGLTLTLFMSCAAKKWDGEDPPAQRKNQCAAVMQTATPGLILAPVTGGLTTAILPSPANEFWATELNQNIVEHLTEGFGGPSGNYVFDRDFVHQNFSKGAPPLPQQGN